MGAVLADSGKCRVRRRDARQHGIVAALNARHVDHARRAAKKRTARKREIGHRLPAAFGDGARAIGNALAAFKDVANGCVRLEALELIVWREIRIFIIQVQHEPDRHEVVAVVIQERSAARLVVERPAERMLHETRPVLRRLHLPEFLEADAVLLRLVALVETKLLDQNFTE